MHSALTRLSGTAEELAGSEPPSPRGAAAARQVPAGQPVYSLRWLRAFIAVADCGAVSRAALRLHREQSAVTRSVHELERAVGAALFERHHSGMILTPTGLALLQRARRAAAELDQARRDVQACTESGGRTQSSAMSPMQLGGTQLAALVGLTELHHMSAVALRLGVSQPAVSMAIRSLEAAFQVRLFERTARGMFPTSAANALSIRVKLAFAELRHAAQEIEALRGIASGQVAVGVLALGRSAVIVPQAVALLHRAHPGIGVSLFEGSFADQEPALRSGDIDFVIGALRNFPPGSDLTSEPLFEDCLSVVVRAGHPLSRAPRLTFNDLAQAGWVLNRSGTPGRERLEAAFKDQGLDGPRVLVETGSLAMTRGLLLETDLVTALSREQVAPDLRSGVFEVLPVELPQTLRRAGFMRRKGSILSPAAERLAVQIRQVIAQAGPD